MGNYITSNMESSDTEDVVVVKATIRNHRSFPVAFKVKTNFRKKVTVNHTTGILGPGESKPLFLTRKGAGNEEIHFKVVYFKIGPELVPDKFALMESNKIVCRSNVGWILGGS